MADTAAETGDRPEKSGKAGLITGILLALAGAAGGFFLMTSGVVPLGLATGKADAAAGGSHSSPAAFPAVAFVDLTPVVVDLQTGGGMGHLRFHAQLEVAEEHAADVERMRPRIMDVLNGYLRAVEVADLKDPLALTRLRGHLLRRINIVVGEGRVRDVLVGEFVLN
ncbi:flagellar basal body protein FliL [Ruegeria marisrubri]|uniref:Flagellar protein FliL n=1 Tax=Ruegeria marisrubri TaxID=1685379 RepID=A0A0X3TL85_9RHOB|nr:flagellar basal body-associated FliL family protein [Ruegeria marisrubri]KUJ76494.1 flagellar basal body protein FliL [Ruegeria marisrubri]